ncbi:MAG: hypothetical protein IPK33_33200 [Gemmatimonadetes bacterium]|nr:hypothetical protein [Gemmatimonadota bacterium]
MSVATDSTKGGGLAADRLGELLGDRARCSSSPPGRLGEYHGARGRVPGAAGGNARDHRGVVNQYAGATRETVSRHQRSLLNRFGGDLQGIFTASRSSTVGMLLALQDIGKAGRSRFVGFDATQVLIDAMKAGSSTGSPFAEPDAHGLPGRKAMVAHLRRQPFEKKIDTGVTMVTPETLDRPEVQDIIHAPPIDKYLKGELSERVHAASTMEARGELATGCA